MYLHLSSKVSGRLFYSPKGWFPNCRIEFYFRGNQLRVRTDKKLPEAINRHAVNIYKKHFLR